MSCRKEKFTLVFLPIFTLVESIEKTQNKHKHTVTLTFSLTHALSFSLPHSHTRSLPLSLFPSLTLSLSLPLSLTLSLSLSVSFSHSLSLSLSHSKTCSNIQLFGSFPANGTRSIILNQPILTNSSSLILDSMNE